MRPVDAFVKHLENSKFSLAIKYLSANVVYSFRGQDIVGADNVMACYQGSYESVNRQLDEIIFESKIIDLGRDRFQTNYTDILLKDNKKHIHRCYQILQFNGSKILKIQHFDIEGELPALEAFFKENNIVRTSK